MEVNPSTRSIKYYVSQTKDFKNKYHAFKIENVNFKDKTYRMIVSLGWPGAGLKLIKFHTKFAKDDGD